MPNTVLNPSIIAKEALMILDNSLVMANQVHRAPEDEFTKSINGYKIGAQVSIRKPAQFAVRNGAVASAQDVVEGTTSIAINIQQGVDFKFSSTELTLSIGELSERVIKPAMVPLANAIDQSLMGLYNKVNNYVGTPGTAVGGFPALARVGQRMDEGAVPQDQRSAVLSPADHWAVAATQVGLYMEGKAKTAYEKAKLGQIADLELYKSQNVPTHTVGTKAGTPVVNGAGQAVAYTAVKDTGIQTLNTNGWTASSAILKAGDVFTIAGVFKVNPVTKAVLPVLEQFVVQADISADGAGAAALSIYPAIIASGAFQTVSAAPASGAAITVLGSAGTGYSQNLAFHKNAFALAMVPMEKPPGAVQVSRQSYKGLSVRVIPYYDGTNDVSNWRLDVLYGVKAIDPRLACRFNG